MTYKEAVIIFEGELRSYAIKVYDLTGYKLNRIQSHEGGRNVVYCCEKEHESSRILRISYLEDRNKEDLLAETEYIRYLARHGGSVADVITSTNGNLVEEITYHNNTFFLCLFEKARGIMISDNNYRYREGVPLSEYFYNTGKTLGKLHQLSKEYTPVHARDDFFDKYNATYIDALIPDQFIALKAKIKELLERLGKFEKNQETYGMVHFDFSDGNYMIDYSNGDITVYDFDNSCFCWYMFDLANLWTHGVGWIQFEPDAQIRKRYMEDYFKTIISGYRSETNLDDAMLAQLPFFIQIVLIENIVDEFEVMRNEGEESEEELEEDEDLMHNIKCLVEDIPYEGFF